MSDSFSPPPAIRTDATNAFAHNTMRVRVPAIIREVQALNPDYPAPIRAALDRLHDDVQGNAPIPPLELPAPDYDLWSAAVATRRGDTWHATDWFFAETYVYRLIIQAVRWWETGRDPFAPKKMQELDSPSLRQTLDDALSGAEMPPDERLAALIVHTLWGNRIDLSLASAMAHGGHWTDDDLLCNHQEQAVQLLAASRGAVHVIHDNTGTELAMDFVLVDALLNGFADSVVMHLKFHPTFVSDATLADAHEFMARLCSGRYGDTARALGNRLQAAFNEQRLHFAPDLFWNSPYFLWELPPRLRATFRSAKLVIVKGDANYRRVVGDALWQPGTPLRAITASFPAPLLLVRTMKSDPIVGLAPERVAALDAAHPDWRVNGRRGLIQASWI